MYIFQISLSAYMYVSKCVCMYMFVLCMYINCIHICVFVCFVFYMFIFTCMYVLMYAPIYWCTYIYTYIIHYVCLSVSLYVCIHKDCRYVVMSYETLCTYVCYINLFWCISKCICMSYSMQHMSTYADMYGVCFRNMSKFS